MAYAHSRNDRGERQDLVEHLRGVSKLAGDFAAALGAAEAGRWLGLWHDVGKFDPEWQRYLLAAEASPKARLRRIDHKAAGARLAAQHLGAPAMLVHGHHGGLQTPNDLRAWLAERARTPNPGEAVRLALQAVPELEPTACVALPAHVGADRTSAELFLRLLFSALVDADFLDTERHTRGELALLRGPGADLQTLWERFERDQARRFPGRPVGAVAEVRRDVYEACLAAADRPPGLFRLTVPTGGGKTRSAMAFALKHALRHGHRRVIVAVPFISITQQTAEVYRSVFGSDDDARPAVLEHHTGAVGSVAEPDEYDPSLVWSRLAAENWDAPIIVTTTVQLFESLFSNRTSRCRRLHNLARSVIILDEVQALPLHLLGPILDVLRELCRHYGVTVVLSTATQPAFEAIPDFAGLGATEIVPDPDRLFQRLERVEYDWHVSPPLSWAEVADLMRSEPRALAVVNTKKDAFALLDALGDPDALHLSTQLCGAHRRTVLAEVRRRLDAGLPCRLVSTQVVEAGVDLDFPVVLRAVGPLDAIIQAAGRCNREGRLTSGKVIVFRPAEEVLPRGTYWMGAKATLALIETGDLDLHNPATARRYYERLLGLLGTSGIDRERIQALRSRLDYPKVASEFRMIDDDTIDLVVAYGAEGERQAVAAILDRLRGGATDGRVLLRRLQPYLVSVRKRQAEREPYRSLISPVLPGLGEWIGRYDRVRGLVADDQDAEGFVI